MRFSKAQQLKVVLDKVQPFEEMLEIDKLAAIKLIHNVIGSDMNFREKLVVLYLNNSNRLICYDVHSVGGTDVCTLNIRSLTAIALSLNATGVIIGHNHPSGNLTASTADRKSKMELKRALKMFNIRLMDCLILGPDNFKSY